MTRTELHTAFKVVMDKNSQSTAFGGCPAFLPQEIDLWLDKGMFLLISNKFTGNNTLSTKFEGSVKRVQDLETLVKTDDAITATLKTGTNIVVLSGLLNRTSSNRGRMFYVSSTLTWTRPNDTDVIKRNTTAPISLIDHELANKFLESYNNKPWIDTPVAVVENNSLNVYVDTTTMKTPYQISITYIKYPTLVEDLDDIEGMTEIPEYMQHELVDRAVALALEDIESKRAQTKTQINTINE